MAMKWKYQVKSGDQWVTCSKARVMNKWLHYELKDGTNGLARPGKWRLLQTDCLHLYVDPATKICNNCGSLIE